jgi:hypothetical protein
MKLFVTEFAGCKASADGKFPFPNGVVASHALDVGPKVAVSEPMSEDTTLVRVLCDTPCVIAIGESPEVEVTKRGPIALAGGIPEVFGIHRGHRIAAIVR